MRSCRRQRRRLLQQLPIVALVCVCVLSIQSTCFNKALILPHTLTQTHTHTDADTHNKRLSAEVHSYKNVHLFSYHCACCRSCCCCCSCHCVRMWHAVPLFSFSHSLSLCQFAYVWVLYTSTHTLAVFAAFTIEIKFTCDFSLLVVLVGWVVAWDCVLRGWVWGEGREGVYCLHAAFCPHSCLCVCLCDCVACLFAKWI